MVLMALALWDSTTCSDYNTHSHSQSRPRLNIQRTPRAIAAAHTDSVDARVAAPAAKPAAAGPHRSCRRGLRKPAAVKRAIAAERSAAPVTVWRDCVILQFARHSAEKKIAEIARHDNMDFLGSNFCRYSSNMLTLLLIILDHHMGAANL